MAYVREMISELEAYALASGGGTVDKYISTKNCAALYIGVIADNVSGNASVRADFASKLGTVEVWASTKDGGGPQVSIDFDDLPGMVEKLPLGGLTPQRNGPSIRQSANTNNYKVHAAYLLPLSPCPLLPTFGYRDARIKISYTSTETNVDNFLLYVGALLHDQKPQYYVQTLMHTETGVATNGKVDEDMTEGGHFMGAYVMGTTSQEDLAGTDATTLTDLAVVVDNSELARWSARCAFADQPPGTYMAGAAGATVTSTDSAAGGGGTEYMYWDTGWSLSSRDGIMHGVPIGRNYKLRIKTNAADAIRAYHLTALPVGPN